ncbi:MAG: hypothetical protein WDW36_002017 [Sanguina aurantia]
MADRVIALIHYYSREGYARQIQGVCNEVLKKRAGDPVLIFWRAYGLQLEGNSAEALRELSAIAESPDLELAAAAAMLRTHESAKIVDQDAVMDLQSRMDALERSASESASLHLASFLLYTNSKERARSLVERVLRNQPDNPLAHTLLGWIVLAQHQDEEMDLEMDGTELDEAQGLFEGAVQRDGNDLEALLGVAKCCELRKDYANALAVLGDACSRFGWFMPSLVEKTRLLLATNRWEEAQECISRVLAAEPQNVMALAWTTLHTIVREGNNKVAAKQLQEVFTAANRGEPKNAELLYRLCRPFSRVACGDPQLLSITAAMADRALQIKPDHAPYAVEVGCQRLMQDDYPAAAEKFASALLMDELSLSANAGAMEAALMAGHTEDSAGQMDMLQELFSSTASLSHSAAAAREPPLLMYLKGLLSMKQGRALEGMAFLERCITGLFESAGAHVFSLEMFAVLDPARLAASIKLLLSNVGGEPRAPTEAPSPLIAKCNRALDRLSKQAPSLIECQMLHARALYLNGSLEAAQRKASDVLRVNPEEFTAHLLICSVYVHQDKASLALSALDQAVSANFTVRETPLFHIVNAKVLLSSGKVEECRRVLDAAMSLPGVRKPLTPQQRARMGPRSRILEPSLHERATVYLLLAEVISRLAKVPNAPEATKYIQDAISEFRDSSEEVRVTVADCELAIARGDVEGALKRLRKIPSGSPHYTKARMAMADIYLKHRKDKASYCKCYLDLVDRDPSYDSNCMMGEAFMQIQEPEKAVRAFESALEFNPKDSELIARVARALVTTHDYQRAIEFYNRAVYNNRGSTPALQLELTTLLIRLRQWPLAMSTLDKILKRERSASSSMDNLTSDVESWSLMARVYKGNSDMDNYVSAQSKALELQRGLLVKMRGELPEPLMIQREKAADICFDLAEHHQKTRRFDKAIELYNEALGHYEHHSRSSLALAKLQLAEGDSEGCQAQCVSLLKLDPDNEEASIMLAELMFHKEHYDTAIYHFHQLLERSPNHYAALAQVIQLLRRAGKLEDVPKYLAQAENGSPKAAMDPGYHYCKGLHSRYTNDPREALKNFNLARKDSRWGAPSILHMVEVYLNPDNDAVWEEKENADTPEGREAVNTARSLLSQVRPQDTQSQRFKVLECYAMMASKDKNEVEGALNRLLDMANTDPNNVPVLLAMATGFMMLKQTPKARNQLKRVQKVQYKPDEAEEFERSWLLLADIHIQGGKYDLAQDLCQKCLKYNKSCAKAWEIMGEVMEREQAYKDAAEHYENAWKHENQASGQVGYKLAFNYLKAKRFVEAIDVCHKVIKAFPEYPRIKKDILEKARAGLKP